MAKGGESIERKLRQIYDAFDSRNPKLALKLSTAGVQKHPENQMMRALRAVGLERAGKLDEALKAVDELLACTPTDDSVLHTLVYVLRPAGRLGDLTGAYERAVAKGPPCEELLVGLFGCYVRDFNFAKQQQAALRLQKAFPSERHQWWVVDSIALQARAAADAAALPPPASPPRGSAAPGPDAAPVTAAAGGGGALGGAQLLQLAESMAARLVAQRGGGIQGVEALDLYLGVLVAQGKASNALALLDGPLGAAVRIPSERRQARAALLSALGRRGEAAALYRAAVQEQPDDWASLQLLLDCSLPPAAAGGQAPPAGFWHVARALRGGAAPGGGAEADGGDAADAAGAAAAFLESLPAAGGGGEGGGGGGPVLRGPALARVELAARRVKLGLEGPRALAEAVLACYDRLGHMLSCAMDLRGYACQLGGADAAWLDAQLSARLAPLAAAAEDEAAAAAATDGRPSGEARRVLRRHVCALQLQEELRGDFPPGAADGADNAAGAPSERSSSTSSAVTAAAAAALEAEPPAARAAAARALELVGPFLDGLPLAAGLDERERGPADELLSLAAAALVRAAGAAGGGPCPARLLRAGAVLEAGVCGRPYGGEWRLALTALFGLLGCAPAAAAHFFKTEAKHIQMDTLASHHLLPAALAVGADKVSGPLLAQTLALFDDHMRDAGDTLMQAYKQDTHTKVLEFVQFKERLQRAHAYAVARAELAILKMRQQLAAPPGGAAPPVGPAAAAAAALPLGELGGPAWRGMRFNQDLQTRPSWLPPAPCAAHIAVMHWWEASGGAGSVAGGGGGGPAWWRRVAAAECELPQAAALRAAQRDGALQRWLLPHLLAAALGGGGAAAAAAGAAPGAAGGGGLAELVGRLAAALGVPAGSDGELEAALAAAFGGEPGGGGGGGGAPASRQLQLLDLALFHTAEAAGRLLGGGNADIEAAAAETARRAALLASGLGGLRRRVEARLTPAAAPRGLLPGDALSLAALLVDEGCLWAACCLEAWSKAVKASRKKATKKPAAGAAAPPAAAGLSTPAAAAALAALAAASAAAAAAAGAVGGGAKALLARPADAGEAALLELIDPAAGALMRQLAGWEPRLSAAGAARAALGEQRQVLQRLAGAGAALQQRLATVAW
ncbi:MAG: N-acetyltransferase B complex non catalytic subunit-domain-containing protein [Monoraphidium minutum]|nr:MAG: N-acetyltransferase B complex non catalytic subunit-domain-containing protein [Monoraphidium minutum]